MSKSVIGEESFTGLVRRPKLLISEENDVTDLGDFPKTQESRLDKIILKKSETLVPKTETKKPFARFNKLYWIRRKTMKEKPTPPRAVVLMAMPSEHADSGTVQLCSPRDEAQIQELQIREEIKG